MVVKPIYQERGPHAEITQYGESSYDLFVLAGKLTYERKTRIFEEILKRSDPDRELVIDLKRVTETDTTFIGGMVKLLQSRTAASKGNTQQTYLTNIPERTRGGLELAAKIISWEELNIRFDQLPDQNFQQTQTNS
jgi:ABC-type transporter Mla MlaB component